MYIAVDIGGTSIRITSSESLKNLSFENKTEYAGTHDFETDYQRMISEIKNRGNKVSGIGIGIPGDVSKDKKIVHSTNWNSEWENVPFVDMLSKEFNCPVIMDNDAVVAALGIATYGEGKDKEFAYVTWGTGIGGALVTRKDNRYISTKLDWGEYFASWEEKCGGKKMEKNFGRTGNKLTQEDWQKLMTDFLGELSNFINKINPGLIIFGGGISSKQKERLIKLQDKLQNTEIKVSSLGENIGLYGAFALVSNNS